MTEQDVPGRPATLADVAAIVGVSTRTVSRVVNGEPGISDETRARVMAAVRQVGYRPNMAARRLVTRRSELIGLVVPQFDNPYFPLLAVGIEDACTARGQTLLLGQARQDPGRQAEVIESLISHGVDGLILFPEIGTEAQVADVVTAGIPVVTVNWPIRQRGVGLVRTEFEAGARSVAEHFAAAGHRHVGMVSASSEPEQYRFRERGFREGVAAAGLPAPTVAYAKDPTVEEGRRAALDLLQRHPRTTAVFAYNDLIAMGVIRACHELGRTVPASCAVVGFDDIDIAASLTPSLSTVDVDRALIGRSAVELLAQMVEGSAGDSPVVEIPTLLRVRESSGPLGSPGFRSP